MDPFNLGLEMITGALQPQGGQLGGLIDPTGTGLGTATAAPGGAGLQRSLQGLAGLQGAVAPKPITPIMSGGVTGGVKPPDVNAPKVGAPAIQSLIQALMGGSQVPSLGALITGGGR